MPKESWQEQLARQQLKDRKEYERQARAADARQKRDEKAQQKRDAETDRAQGRSGGWQ